jgi:ATP-dependent Clp protease ATP-binding subunit ClpA
MKGEAMFERFAKESKTVVVAAREEAVALGAPTLEAEHLLLAIASNSHSDAGRVLAQSGLDYDGVRTALEREFERSLAAVGVSESAFELDDAPLPTAGTPRWAASSKTVFKRAHNALHAHGGRRLTPTHLLLGVLAGEVGTVPRALAAVGVDRSALATSAQATLA